MDIIQTHKIVFESNNSKIELPEIIDPAYIYKIGDTIRYFDMWSETIEGNKKPIAVEFVVTDIRHELSKYVSGDQTIVVYVERAQ